LNILIADDIPDQIIGAIYNIYNNNKISVKMGPDSSEWRPINEGVQQGCGLSPLLFIIYMDNITKRWRKGNHGGIPINRNLNLVTLLFADNQVIVAQNKDELQRAVYNLQVTASEFNMSVSAEKTKIMAFAGKEPVKSKICVNGKILKQVNTFNYLGCALLYEGEKTWK
jgi:hypothetical protein